MEPLQRRVVLSTLAALGSGAVSGCLGDGDGASGTDGGTDGGDGNSSSQTETEATNSTEASAPEITREVDPDFAGKFTPASAVEHTRFGWSLATAGPYALVGADRDGGPTPVGPGSAFLYEYDGGWHQRTSFTGDAVGDGFADSLALTESVALIGVPGGTRPTGPGAGEVRLYERSENSWSESAVLAAADGGENHAFGTSVALAGETALVGAPGENSLYGIESGAAYVFEREDGEWTQTAKLKPSRGDPANIFGQDVALGAGGNVAVVGAPRGTDPRGREAGRVFVFERGDGTWRQRPPVFAGEGRDEARFGWAVDASGAGFVVGAPGGGAPGGSGAGGAYVFEQSADGWEQVASLSEGEEQNTGNPRGFGFSVAKIGNLVAVGAPLTDAPIPEDTEPEEADVAETGEAAVFQGTGEGWTSRGAIAGDYVKAADHSGWSVAITPERVLTGTPLHERPVGLDVGTVQYFDF